VQLKILMVGSGGSNNEVVVDALRSKGFDIDYTEDVRTPSLSRLKGADVVYGAYLQTCSRYIGAAQMLGKKTVVHFVGSDAYRYAREKGLRALYWRMIVRGCDLVLYVSSHLEMLVRRPGAVLPFPIRIEQFKRIANPLRDRDILYYCPSGEENAIVYRLDWILSYAENHPQEKITILGNSAHAANYLLAMPNVEVIPFVAYDNMPSLYSRHKRLIRMTVEDGRPRMVDEALLSGLEVIFNGEKIPAVPPERDPKVFAERFERELANIL
jgi:hypothetical protein